ncbi:transporter [Fusarium albosuccineum]|uniref:Transporter n=1 Tax=Fusarium albosuccineum TaxID=1237068 RepID=A0A8H4PHE4_9HYPO|nr:transporter [Fusarium albosuccineum]
MTGLKKVDSEEDTLNVEKVDQDTTPYMGLSAEDQLFLDSFSKKDVDKIYRKIDWRLIPALTILYLIAIIDRANIGNAKIEGLEASLGMSGTDYNVAVAIFFVSYILFEIPSNQLLSKFKRPSVYLGSLVVGWGMIMTLTGVVQNFGGLCATRFLLGVFEHTRIAIFYTASAASGAFSGLLAFLIVKMDGVGGYEGWSWFLLPDSPALSDKWLTQEEIRFLDLSHIKFRGRKVERSRKVEVETFWKVIKDWQLYLLGIVFMSNTVPNYALKFTMPQIILNMGFTSSRAQLLTIPPYAVGAISGLLASLLADRFTWRMPFLVGARVTLIIAYAILVSKSEFIKDCLFCLFTMSLTWTVNNLGPRKRAMGVALMVMIGSVGGVIGSFIYLDREKPKYPTGFGTSLAVAGAGVLACLTLETAYWRINKKNEKVNEEEIRSKYTAVELEGMDDRSPLFRYNL